MSYEKYAENQISNSTSHQKKKKKDRDEWGAKTYLTSNTSIRSKQLTETDSVVYSYWWIGMAPKQVLSPNVLEQGLWKDLVQLRSSFFT